MLRDYFDAHLGARFRQAIIFIISHFKSRNLQEVYHRIFTALLVQKDQLVTIGRSASSSSPLRSGGPWNGAADAVHPKGTSFAFSDLSRRTFHGGFICLFRQPDRNPSIGTRGEEIGRRRGRRPAVCALGRWLSGQTRRGTTEPNQGAVCTTFYQIRGLSENS